MVDFDLSFLLGRVLGVFFITASLAIVVNRYRWEMLVGDIEDHHLSLLTAGSLSLISGLIIVFSHDVWIGSWLVLITIVGWVLVAAGVLSMLIPTWAAGLLRRVMTEKTLHFWSLIAFVLGIIFLLGGYNYFPM